jgi:hypothetical protein
MLSAVHLDDEPLGVADEVADVGADRFLAAEPLGEAVMQV